MYVCMCVYIYICTYLCLGNFTSQDVDADHSRDSGLTGPAAIQHRAGVRAGHTILYYDTILYYYYTITITILYYAILYYNKLSYTILRYTALYYAMLYYTMHRAGAHAGRARAGPPRGKKRPVGSRVRGSLQGEPPVY